MHNANNELEILFFSLDACKKRDHHPKFNPDDIITSENCLRQFIPAYVLDSRHEALSAIKDGLTLNNSVDVCSIFRYMPLEFVNRFLFSNPSYTVESVIGVIGKDEEEEDESHFPEEVLSGRKQFIQDTLPQALRTLSKNRKDFLNDFLFFVTGSSLMPHLDGDPGYRIQVMFDTTLCDDNIPMASTCDNLLKVPASHYGNDVDTFIQKLDLSVRYGRIGGFGTH